MVFEQNYHRLFGTCIELITSLPLFQLSQFHCSLSGGTMVDRSLFHVISLQVHVPIWSGSEIAVKQISRTKVFYRLVWYSLKFLKFMPILKQKYSHLCILIFPQHLNFFIDFSSKILLCHFFGLTSLHDHAAQR
jgi:hypothetical protein